MFNVAIEFELPEY